MTAQNTQKKVAQIKQQLPTRDGVGVSCVWLDNSPSQEVTTLLQQLMIRFPQFSEVEWRRRFDALCVIDASGQAYLATHPPVLGQHVFYYRMPVESVLPIHYTLIAETEHLLIVNKPHFLPISPTGKYAQQTVLAQLNRDFPNQFIAPIHRLDKDTAGVVLFAKSPAVAATYQRLFTMQQVAKTYQCVATYNSLLNFPLQRQSHIAKGERFFTMVEDPHLPYNSTTHISLIERRDELGLFEIKPLTGKQHQIRVHMAALGMPIVNDPLYPDVKPENKGNWGSPLQLLAKKIEWLDPYTGANVRYCSTDELVW